MWINFWRVVAYALFGQCLTATADEDQVWFFRVVSDQPVKILSIVRPPTAVDSFAVIAWSNSVPFAPAQVEIKYGTTGSWHTNTSTDVVQTDGHVVGARVALSYVPGQIIVAFQRATSQEEATALLHEYDLGIFNFIKLTNAALVKVPIDSEIHWLSRMITNTIVRYAELNGLSVAQGSAVPAASAAATTAATDSSSFPQTDVNNAPSASQPERIRFDNRAEILQP